MPTSSPGSVLVRRFSPGLVLATLLALAGAAPCQDRIAWRTDMERALREARSAGKPLLVVIHETAEAASDTMLREVYRDARFVAACRELVPVLACWCAEGTVGQATRDFPGLTAEDLRNGERTARRLLFGARGLVLTPQHILLDPRGGVLWHSVRQLGLKQVLEGIKSGRAEFGRSPKDRTSSVARQASELLRPAENEPESYTRLRTLVAHSHEEHFRPVVEVLAGRLALCERVLRDTTVILPAEAAEKRLGSLASSTRVKSLAQTLLGEVRSRKAANATTGVTSLDRPPKSIARAESLEQVRFADGHARPLEELSGAITVLWFFLPDDPTLGAQVAQLTPVYQELSQRGVRFLGLACGGSPGAAFAAASRAGFPFPVGCYPPPSGRRLYGVEQYPSVVVIDRELNVVLCDGADADSMRRGYTGFAALVRGMLQLNYCVPPR